MIDITVKYTITPTEIFSIIYMYHEKICRGDCILHCYVDHPSCSLLFAVLLSLHPATFLMFFITCLCNFFGSRRMFELKFAAEVSDLTGNWAVGVLALVYGLYYSGITLPALAEESGPGISSQLFPRWMTKPLSSPCTLSEDHGIGSL